MLRQEVRLVLSRQPGWLAVGLAGHLLIALYTLFRPWLALRAQNNLLQAALFFAAWNMLYGVIYVCAAWLRPKQEETEREQLHLPLSSAHFALRRLVQTSAVPLAAALLALPLFGVLLLYYQVPFGAEAAVVSWDLARNGHDANPWWGRMLWIGLSILSAALMPPALAAWLDAFTPSRYLRCILMLGVPAGMYYATRLAYGWDYATGAVWGWDYYYGPLVMNYRQTRGVSPWPYLALLTVVILLPVAIGWLRPVWRWALLLLPVCLLSAFMLRKALPEEIRQVFRPYSTALFGRDTRYAAALFVGHLSTPKDMRMLMWTYPSNVLIGTPHPVYEPAYPAYPDELSVSAPSESDFPNTAAYHAALERHNQEQAAAQATYEQAEKDYRAALEQYEAANRRMPRLPLWVTAGLYPLFFPLWAIAGLVLGIKARGEPARDA
jgi:hypothetical protein